MILLQFLVLFNYCNISIDSKPGIGSQYNQRKYPALVYSYQSASHATDVCGISGCALLLLAPEFAAKLLKFPAHSTAAATCTNEHDAINFARDTPRGDGGSSDGVADINCVSTRHCMHMICNQK